jgi:hypothetical protein
MKLSPVVVDSSSPILFVRFVPLRSPFRITFGQLDAYADLHGREINAIY